MTENPFKSDLQKIDYRAILDPYPNAPFGVARTFQDIFESILDLHASIKRRRVRSEFALDYP